MKQYKVFAVGRFKKDMLKLHHEDRRRIEKLFLQLRDNPYVGDQLRHRFFREKRLREKRIYYLVYDDLLVVLVVALGDKKAQQETINEITHYFNEYRRYARELVMED